MNWEPFRVAPSGTRGDAPRSLDTQEGLGDRLRSAAFAEIQAREAFLWAASHFEDASPALKKAWTALARAEDRHLRWLLIRMQELGIGVQERAVSNHLWNSLQSCQSAREFALYMASAEERGQRAGMRFYQALLEKDPRTARIFGRIAKEEIAHIRLAEKFFDIEVRPKGQNSSPVPYLEIPARKLSSIQALSTESPRPVDCISEERVEQGSTRWLGGLTGSPFGPHPF